MPPILALLDCSCATAVTIFANATVTLVHSGAVLCKLRMQEQQKTPRLDGIPLSLVPWCFEEQTIQSKQRFGETTAIAGVVFDFMT